LWTVVVSCGNRCATTRYAILTTGQLWTVVVVCRQKMWRKVCVMATKRLPGTGNVGVSPLEVAQRRRDDSRLADVVARHHSAGPRTCQRCPSDDPRNRGARTPPSSPALETAPHRIDSALPRRIALTSQRLQSVGNSQDSSSFAATGLPICLAAEPAASYPA